MTAEYFYDLMDLCDKIDQDMLDKTRKDFIKHGLPDEYRCLVMICPDSLDKELLDCLCEQEKVLNCQFLSNQ